MLFPTTPEELIAQYIYRLRTAGVRNVEEYETRLRSNSINLQNFNSLLSEAIAALMLLGYGAEVTMRDSPDLAVTINGERFYAEVNHFKRKIQDAVNDQMLESAPEFEFVQAGDATFIEGIPAYRQIAEVAIRKAGQYVPGEINILIVDSESDLLHLMARSAAQEFSDLKTGAPPESPLHRLNGIMLIGSWGGVGRRGNVEFAITRRPARKASFRLLRALARIKQSGASF